MLVKKVLIDRTDRLYQMPPDILDFARPLLGKRLLGGNPVLDLASFSWPVAPETEDGEKLTSLAPATPEKIASFKESLADWLTQYYGESRIAPREIFMGNGIRSLVWLTSLAFVDTGDPALVPGLGIPYYRKAVTAAGGIPVPYPLSIKNNWMPDFSKLSLRLRQAVRVCFVNSPHNPTGAELDEPTFQQLVERASRENMLLVNDACYHGIPSRKPLSIMAIDGGRKVGLELYSFSYLLGLPPIPFGFAVGHRHLIAALEAASQVLPPYIPKGFVDMAAQGLRQSPSKSLQGLRQQFASTAVAARKMLETIGIESVSPPTVPFLWARLPARRNSVTFARTMLKRYRILIAPGTSFGEIGQGFVRVSLTVPAERYAEAAERIKNRHTLTGRRGRT
jgi:LL-diaminopimelate aminotransferase